MNPSLVQTETSERADLRRENAELRLRLEEAEETLEAIRNGEVDALVVGEADGAQVYTLESADRPYRLLIEEMSEGAMMLNEDGMILYSNPALARMLETPGGELAGGALERFVAPGSRAALAKLLDHCGKAQMHFRRPKSGDDFTALMSVIEIGADDAGLLCAVVTDLTETQTQAREIADARARLAVQAARHESDQRYRLILESATDYGILATDLNGRVTTWNSGACKMLGWEAAELIGKSMPPIWTADDPQSSQREIELSLALGRAEDQGWRVRKDGSHFWAASLMMPLRAEDGSVVGFLKILSDRTEQRRAEESQQLLINELNHRVKNTLAIVQSIAIHTLRDGGAPAATRAALEQRLVALARVHDVLTRENWEGAELSEVAAQAVEPYQTDGAARVRVAGPLVRLPPELALAMAMVLQELATNAAKYGALSNGGGQLDISWTCEDGRLDLLWEESGGPTVSPPQRRGFGTRLIERALSAEFGATCAIDYRPAGVVCSIHARLSRPGPSP